MRTKIETNYDIDKAKSLVGQTFKFDDAGQWFIDCIIHDHFFVVSEENDEKYCQVIPCGKLLKDYDKTMDRLAFAEIDIVGKMFKDKGGFEWNNGWYRSDGTKEIHCNFKAIADEKDTYWMRKNVSYTLNYKTGETSGINEYRMGVVGVYRTQVYKCEADPDNEIGLNFQISKNEPRLHLEKVEWHPLSYFQDRLLNDYKNIIDNLENDETVFEIGKEEIKDGDKYIFWNQKSAYVFTPDERDIFLLTVCEPSKKQVVSYYKENNYRTGKKKVYDKWDKPTKTKIVSYKEIKELLLNILKKNIDDGFKEINKQINSNE